ncbi:MAG: type IV secretory system conjugative DNA transfer family protein, partial [Gemmataceae bacterium]
MLASLRVSPTNSRGPQYAEQALAALHQGNPRRARMTLTIGTSAGRVGLFADLPDELSAVFVQQFYAAYPECKIERVVDGEGRKPAGACTWSAELRLAPDLFPIRRYSQFEDALNRNVADPLTAILSAITPGCADGLSSRIDIQVRPARERRLRRAEQCLDLLSRSFFRRHRRLARWFATWSLSTSVVVGRVLHLAASFMRDKEQEPLGQRLDGGTNRLHEREGDLEAAADKIGKHLFEARVRIAVSGPKDSAAAAKARLREVAGAFGQFSTARLACFRLGRPQVERRLLPRSRHRPFLLSTEELATLWHPPTSTVRAERMAMVECREFEPPVDLPVPAVHSDLAVLGLATYRGRARSFGIRADDRRRHLAIVGKTGMGKSTLLQQLMLSDLRAGHGVGLIDPHGDLAEAVLAGIPSYRTNDVVYFDAADRSHPLAFNPLACHRVEQRPLVASGMVAAFKRIHGDSWGPRLEHILRNALLAVLEVPGSSLLSVVTLLTNARERQRMVARVRDPVVRAFWEQEFAALPAKLQAEATAPVLNKLGAFISSPLLRHIVGQARNAHDLREVMDEQRILVANLSKGRLGDDASALLGSFLVAALQLAAMSRADMPEARRRDFHLYVDEFQNYATDSFATVLAEARKYGLSLTLANQFLEQLDEATLAAVFGNVGTLVCFQVGVSDAETLAQQLTGDLLPSDLIQLPRFSACVRLLIN